MPRSSLEYRQDSRYVRLTRKLAAEECVMLDGATGTELFETTGAVPELDEARWGVSAIVDAPDEVQAVHRRYAEAGCDVISTNTWGLPTALRRPSAVGSQARLPVHWMDVARRGISLARAAASDAGRSDEVAVAFSINGDVDAPDGLETIRLLARAFEEEPPDLLLVETLSLVGPSTYATVEALVATELPVWLSFRRCRHGVCGVYGEHWDGPEGDAFGRAARHFEELGVKALLINCVPPDHVTGMISWLRDFTDLPLGAYPNLGYLSSTGWRHEPAVDGPAYAELALSWREEGAQIIGGCCGVGPEHIEAAQRTLSRTAPGRARPVATPDSGVAGDPGPSWTDAHGEAAFPVPFPDLLVDPGVAAPLEGSLMLWKYLQRSGIGAHQRCLDIGCGAGLLAVQLARNAASHVHAIDADPSAVATTMTNAFRNGVADRLTAVTADLYPWVPQERYDVIVADLDLLPVDPAGAVTSHRPLDYWGRNLLDHLISLLPEALTEDGMAYVLQPSIIGQQRTLQQLRAHGLRARVLDFTLARMEEQNSHIDRVEARSDAYLLNLGGDRMSVVYLLEITR